jgi:hypothetical protein
MAVTDRIALIKEIEKARGSKMLAYVGSTRMGASYNMQQLDIRVLSKHIQNFGKTKKIDLFLHSFGGDITFPWRLVNLIREYSSDLNVIIPLHAFSAATLISLGANSVTMLPQACLGPTDPQSTSPFNPKDGQNPNYIPINTEDIEYYMKFVKEDLKISSEEGAMEALRILSQSDNRVHPIALGHAKRGSKLAEKYAKELLSTHMKKTTDKPIIDKIVKTFGSELYAHDHPINRDEAKKLGLNIIIEKPAIEAKIWELFLNYEAEMELNQPFDQIFAFKKIQPVIPLSIGTNINAVQQTLPKTKMVMVESEKMTDTFLQEFDVTGLKYLDANGKINETYSWIVKSASWNEDVR